jgi:hypothetical protein
VKFKVPHESKIVRHDPNAGAAWLNLSKFGVDQFGEDAAILVRPSSTNTSAAKMQFFTTFGSMDTVSVGSDSGKLDATVFSLAASTVGGMRDIDMFTGGAKAPGEVTDMEHEFQYPTMQGSEVFWVNEKAIDVDGTNFLPDTFRNRLYLLTLLNITQLFLIVGGAGDEGNFGDLIKDEEAKKASAAGAKTKSRQRSRKSPARRKPGTSGQKTSPESSTQS